MSWRADRFQNSNSACVRILPSRLRTDPASVRIAVLAAHPDDEVIGASTLLSTCPQPVVIFLTDGAPRDRRLWPPDWHGSREEYAQLRRVEAHNALGQLGISDSAISWLGAIDQEAIFQVPALSSRLAHVLLQTHFNALVTHPYEGGHPDHDSATLIAHLAVSQLQPEKKPEILEMTSYHARGAQCVTGEFLNSDPESEIAFELSTSQREQKRSAFAAYKSQSLVLSTFPLERERFRVAPEYHFSKPPHPGELWYERMGWMTGDRWRALAAQTLLHEQEQMCR